MTIAKKPKDRIEEDKVSALIDKGGSVAERKKIEEGVKLLQLRIPASTLNEIDDVIQNKRPKPPRHAWLLEAIYEKLDREGRKN